MNLGKWLAPEAKSEAARARRRSYPVQFFAGRNGAGKTLAAVYDTLPDLDAGRPVLSTVRLLDFRNPRPCDDPACVDVDHGRHMAAHPCYVPFTTWPQFLDFKQGVILMDEITGVADSMDGASLPGSVANKLAQMRRDELVVRITGLNFIRANKRIRESVNAVTRCRSLLAVTVKDETGADRLWRQRQLAIWHTYDAQSLPIDDHSESAYASADHLVGARHWIPTSMAAKAYDTYAPVSVVGTVTDSGRCAHCAGTRRAQECSCEDYLSEKSERRGAGAQSRSGEHRRTAVPPSRPVASQTTRA